MPPDVRPAIRRLKQVLPVVLRGELGLVEGEIWWLDPPRIALWCRERLPLERELDLRVDLRSTRAMIDLQALVHEVREGRVANGYIHQATCRTSRPPDLAALVARVRELNPELEQISVPSSVISAPGVGLAERSPPVPPRDERWEGRGRPAPTIATRASPDITLPPDAAPGATMVVFPSDPPSLFLRIPDPDELRHTVRLMGPDVQVTLDPPAALAGKPVVLVVLQLPNLAFVQFEARATATTEGSLTLLARGVEGSVLALLRAELGRA